MLKLCSTLSPFVFLSLARFPNGSLCFGVSPIISFYASVSPLIWQRLSFVFPVPPLSLFLFKCLSMSACAFLRFPWSPCVCLCFPLKRKPESTQTQRRRTFARGALRDTVRRAQKHIFDLCCRFPARQGRPTYGTKFRSTWALLCCSCLVSSNSRATSTRRILRSTGAELGRPTSSRKRSETDRKDRCVTLLLAWSQTKAIWVRQVRRSRIAA